MVRTVSKEEARGGWERRRFAGALVRVTATLAPAIVSGAAALVLNALVPGTRTLLAAIVRSLLIIAVSFAVLLVVDKLARRWLPLASLLQLSLVFPDKTPSRFRMALKAGSGRSLAREVEAARRGGLSTDRSRAAEQLVLLATAIGDHDRRTRGHSERVRLYTQLLGEELKLSPEELARLQWAALIHDIGKIHVPVNILNKRGRPTPREWEILKTHPAHGEALAAPVAGWLGEWVHAIGGHHERFDGTGYPSGLSGRDIPRAAAIVAVADAFEVMTAVRSYKKAMPLPAARAELTRSAGTHFDPAIVRAFLSISIGDTRRAMGLLGSLAHLPLIGRFTTAAAYASDVVPLAQQAATTTATAGLGAAAITTAVMTGPSAASPAPSQPRAATQVTTTTTTSAASPTSIAASTRAAPTTQPRAQFRRPSEAKRPVRSKDGERAPRVDRDRDRAAPSKPAKPPRAPSKPPKADAAPPRATPNPPQARPEPQPPTQTPTQPKSDARPARPDGR